MDIKEQILVALGLNKGVEVSMEWQAKTEDGTILTSTADELVTGVDVSVLTEDGTTIPLPIGTYKLDTGVSFTVEEEGIVAEVMETETEEVVEEVVEAAEDGEEADVADWKGMEKRIENLEIAIASLKEDKVESTEEMAEEITQPSTLPKTITTKEVKEFSIDDLKAENAKLKAELAAQPDSLALDTNKFSSNKPTLSKTNYNKLSRKDKFLYDLNN
jgi:TolA-binding protein